MKLNPLEDRIVVEPLEAKDTTKGGIVLPDTAKEKPQQGKVIAVGPGRMLDSGERAKPAVKKGDVVIFAKYGGADIEIDETEYKILRESDVLAKVE
jgi:chaperonin GroES